MDDFPISTRNLMNNLHRITRDHVRPLGFPSARLPARLPACLPRGSPAASAAHATVRYERARRQALSAPSQA